MPEPVGSIIAFGGWKIDRVWEAANGWMHCDGRLLNKLARDYAALFDAIGFSWGGDHGNMFNIPDLQGFFLRGVYGASDYLTPVPFQVDPDRNERIQIRPGGNHGDKVGSVQSFGTALPPAGSEFQIQPAGGHAHQLPFYLYATRDVKDEESDTVTFPNHPNAAWVDTAPAPDHVHEIKGGNKETRPVNAYVHWIIRYK
jgi:hypothetical protein